MKLLPMRSMGWATASEQLVSCNVAAVHGPDWLRHLRYRVREASIGEVTVGTGTLEFEHRYERLGCSPGLTPSPSLTRNAYALCKAAQLQRAAVVAGPSDSGTAATLRDMIKFDAAAGYHITCPATILVRDWGRLLSGTASSSTWCCFDVPRYVNAKALSALAQQVFTFRQGAWRHQAYCEFKECTLRLPRGVFIAARTTGAGVAAVSAARRTSLQPVALAAAGMGGHRAGGAPGRRLPATEGTCTEGTGCHPAPGFFLRSGAAG